MQDSLYEDKRRWKQMVQAASEPEVIELVELAKEPLSFDSADLLGCPIETETINSESFGECNACHKHRRLWSGICAWCGADPDDYEE